MEEERMISKEIPYSLEQVWQVMQRPFEWDLYMNPKSERISDVEWIVPGSEKSNKKMETRIICDMDPQTHTVHLEGKANFKKKSDHSYVCAEAVDENTTRITLKMDIFVGKNVAAKLVMKSMGNKIVETQMDQLAEKLCKLCAEQ